MASTSLADSAAAFEKQAAHLGLLPEYVRGLKRDGITNLGRLAFSCGQPGSPLADQEVKDLLQRAAPLRAVTVGDIVVAKRLIFEAQTSMVALTRAQADPVADPSLRKMPAAERTSRLAEQKLRLTGLNLSGPLEVAHQVYDIINGMSESETLKYLAPSKCITRLQEIQAAKPPKELKLDSTGQGLLVKEAQSDQTCGVNGELDLWEAMTRRSLAFDACGIIDYEIFQKWVQYMFQVMRQPAPPGFKQLGITQLLRTDRQAFVRMQELTRDGIKPKPDGTRPLDQILQDMAQDHTVMFYMLPTVAPASSKADKPKPKAKAAAWDGHGNDDGQNWKKTKPSQWKQQQKGQKHWGAGGASAGKLPAALKGCAASLPDGSRLCFAYNISGCDKGDNCDKGKHLCATKGCHDKHPHYACPKK